MKFSIITTVFNSEATIRDTINSVKSGFSCYEHIVVDAGSTDGTLEYLRSVSGINLFVQHGLNIAEAWNFALCKASGDYIGILNADDFYTNNIESELLKSVSISPEADIIIGPVSLINKELEEVYFFKARIPNKLNLIFGIPFLHPSVFVKKSFYTKNQRFNESMNVAFDADWLLKSIKLNAKFSIHKSIVKMRDGGISKKYPWIGFGEYIQSLSNNGYSNIYILGRILIKGLLMSFKQKG